MQFTTKFAFLAAAFVGAVALPLVPRDIVDYEIEAREVEPELSAREFYDMYLEVRSDPTLDARTLDIMDLEAREYLEYLEARDAANAAGAQTPLAENSAATPSTAAGDSKTATDASGSGSSSKSTSSQTSGEKDVESHEHKHKHKSRHLHKMTPEAEAYLADKTNYHHALSHSHDRYHYLAIKQYLSDKEHMREVLQGKKHSKFRKIALKLYFSDKENLRAALKDKKSYLHRDAKRYKKYMKNHKHRHGHKNSGKSTETGSSSAAPEPTSTGNAAPASSAPASSAPASPAPASPAPAA